MERSHSPDKPPSSESSRTAFEKLAGPLILTTLLQTACASPPPASPTAGVHPDWNRVDKPRYAPWGDHQELVDQTRQNITLYVHAVLEHSSGREQSDALREVLHLRTEIDHYEHFTLGKSDQDLDDFIAWIRRTNRWAMVHRERLRSQH